MPTTKPLLYSADMILAKLAGRKTQTRRPNGLEKVNKDPDRYSFLIVKDGIAYFMDHYKDDTDNDELAIKCPYAVDYLWIQESYSIATVYKFSAYGTYLADYSFFEMELTDSQLKKFMNRRFPYRKTTGRFMYRSLSRLTDKVTNIRVERLQDISEADAKAEGCESVDISGMDESEIILLDFPHLSRDTPYINGYSALWDSINGKKYPWSSNPWVWVITSEVIHENIDEVLRGSK